MTLIVLLIVFCVEYYWRLDSQYRSFSWFQSWHQKLSNQLVNHEFFAHWLGIGLLVLAPVLLLWLLLNLFNGVAYFIITLVVSSFILFISLRIPHLLTALEPYFSAVKKADYSTATSVLQNQFANKTVKQESLVRDASKIILTESQQGYFSVIFWFVLLGPYGALAYRLSYEYYQFCCKSEYQKPVDDSMPVDDSVPEEAVSDYDEGELRDQANVLSLHFALMQKLVYWLDWLPVRLTGLMFLLAGDFVRGSAKFSQFILDFDTDNDKVVNEVGLVSLGLKDKSDLDTSHQNTVASEGQDATSDQNGEIPAENKLVGSLIKRTAIIYLVVVALLSPIFF